ncbi:MAG: phosphatase [Flavobacteriales bacterium]|nr:phosphatase [Flavobacteriales bacterium]
MSHEVEFSTLFLDRDGVINKKISGYISSYEEFNFIDGVFDSLRILSKKFQRIIIITNQQGIGKGLMTENDLLNLHSQMLDELSKYNVKIDKIYFCPHLENFECNCRKPKPGMIIQAAQEFPDIDFKKSYLLGDSDSDIEAGLSMGIKSIKLSENFTLKNWSNLFTYIK